MPHEIETMFYKGETPWHNLGRKVDGALTSEQAIEMAGLNWDVTCEPLFTAEGAEVSHRATCRSSDGRVLGVVGPDYTPLQNKEAFSWFDPFVTANLATYETAGSLREGGRVWILAKLNRDDSVIVPQSDDRVAKYILLSNGHDGSLAVRVGFTPIRVVCANTLALAHSETASKLIRFKHTSNIVANLETAREVMNLANAQFEATAEQYRAMADRQISNAELEAYVMEVFDLKAPGTKADGTLRTSRVVEAVRTAFEHGRGNDMAGVRGTVWAAYNAVTEYISHDRGTDDATRLDSTWYGDGAAKNAKALVHAWRLVKR